MRAMATVQGAELLDVIVDGGERVSTSHFRASVCAHNEYTPLGIHRAAIAAWLAVPSDADRTKFRPDSRLIPCPGLPPSAKLSVSLNRSHALLPETHTVGQSLGLEISHLRKEACLLKNCLAVLFPGLTHIKQFLAIRLSRIPL